MKIIGEINGNRVELGKSGNGFIYKNEVEFDAKSNKICYIPELGIEGDTITEDTSVYRYSDFLEIATDYIQRNNLSSTPQSAAEMLFDCVDWQHPETLIGEWEIDLDFENYAD